MFTTSTTHVCCLPQTFRYCHLTANTSSLVFSSPLPNKQIWATTTFGHLQAQEFLHNGGWWHNPNILAATGRGVEKEEPRAWEGCWNEQIVELVRLSMEDKNTLTVLLTGRMEGPFSDLIHRMLKSKGLEFDMVCLKPTVSPSGEQFNSTMTFKQALLQDIVYTYSSAGEIRVYEDRPKHTKAFRDYFADMNRALLNGPQQPPPRQPITAEVIQVAEQDSFMDPTTEIAEVQRMINTHNSAILSDTAPANATPYKLKRSVFYTGYLISPNDTEKLKTLAIPPNSNIDASELKILANNILITPRPAPHSILKKVGGIGAVQRWRVTGIANHESRVWAARVAPTNPETQIYTENATPYVVLATRRTAKPIEASRIRNWQPVPDHQAFEFDTTVGEKVLLRIDEEVSGEDEYEASFPNGKNARKHPREEDFPALGAAAKKGGDAGQKQNQQSQPQHQKQGGNAWAGNNNRGGGGIGFSAQRGSGSGGGGNRGGRGGGQGFRGGGRGGGRGGQRGGRGGRGGYRSLDANVGSGYGGGSMEY